MQTNETKTEAQDVVLTPFLAEVKRRAEARGFATEMYSDDLGQPWLRVVIGPALICSVWNRSSYILTAQVQDIDPVQLVANAVRVANAAMALLAEQPSARVQGFRKVDVDGLGTELQPCADSEAEWFSTEELQGDGRWLVLADFPTRAAAEAAL